MDNAMWPRWVKPYCLLAGAADTTTGLLLIGLPLPIFALLGLEPVPSEPIYARFVGVFVFAVGFLYLYPFLLGAAQRSARLLVALEATALARAAVALFLGVAMGVGALGWGWATVFLTDASLAAVQLVVLRRYAAVPWD